MPIIHQSLSRRDFMRSMSAAGLATLASDEPRSLIAAEPVTHPKATADTCILLWMARRHGIARNLRSEALHSLRNRRAFGKDPVYVPLDPYGRRQRQDLARIRECRQGDGSGNLDPFARRGRPGQHPALAPPVSLAHRLRAAADRGRTAYRLLDCAGSRSSQSGDPAIHQHRSTARRRRRVGRAESVHHRRILRDGVRPIQPAVPQRCRRCRPSTQGHDCPFASKNGKRSSRNCSKRSPVGELSTDYHHESMLRSFENAHRLLSSKERDAFDLSKEPKASSEKYNTRADSGRAACSLAGSPRPARALSK